MTINLFFNNHKLTKIRLLYLINLNFSAISQRIETFLVDGGYSDYGDWSTCSAECGGGTRTRSRTCTNPAPAHGGADCVGDSTETRDCNMQGCPGNHFLKIPSRIDFSFFLEQLSNGMATTLSFSTRKRYL